MPNFYTKRKVENSFTFKNLPWTLKFKSFFGAAELYKYSVLHYDREFILVSKECFQDSNYSTAYLEDFLRSFKYCEWDKKEIVERNCEVFKEINPQFFPRVYLPHKRKQVNIELDKKYNSALLMVKDVELLLKNKDNFLKKLGGMIKLLEGIRDLEHMMTRLRIEKAGQNINAIKSKYNL